MLYLTLLAVVVVTPMIVHKKFVHFSKGHVSHGKHTHPYMGHPFARGGSIPRMRAPMAPARYAARGTMGMGIAGSRPVGAYGPHSMSSGSSGGAYRISGPRFGGTGQSGEPYRVSGAGRGMARPAHRMPGTRFGGAVMFRPRIGGAIVSRPRFGGAVYRVSGGGRRIPGRPYRMSGPRHSVARSMGLAYSASGAGHGRASAGAAVAVAGGARGLGAHSKTHLTGISYKPRYFVQYQPLYTYTKTVKGRPGLARPLGR